MAKDDRQQTISDYANLINAGTSVANVAISGRANKRAARTAKEINAANIAYQREVNDLNWRRALQQWNMENAYNSPSAQMARYQAAGLNPNLIYQQENTASDIGAPDAVAPQSNMQEAELQGRVPDLMPLMTAAQNAVTNYQAADLRRQEIEKLRLLNENQSIVNKYLDQKEYLSAERAKRELRSVELDISQKEFDQSVEQRVNLLINQKLDVQKKIQEIKESNVSIAHKKQSIANLEQAFRQNAELQGYRVAAAYYDMLQKQFENDQNYEYVKKMNSVKLRQAFIQLSQEEFLNTFFGGKESKESLLKVMLAIFNKLMK